MVVTTRKRAALIAVRPEALAKKAAPARRKPATKLTKKAVETEPELEEQGNHKTGQEKPEEEEQTVETPSQTTLKEDAEKTKITQDADSDEELFKIHTPKTATGPMIIPTALPTMKYDDEDDDEDSDAAPEAESLSSAKAKVLDVQDKEKSFLSKYVASCAIMSHMNTYPQALSADTAANLCSHPSSAPFEWRRIQSEQKAKRVEREEKLKTQKEQAKKRAEAKAKRLVQNKEVDKEQEREEEAPKPTTKSGLPELLPMDILESVAQMEDSQKPSGAQGSLETSDRRKKHLRPEDFALMELEAELKAAAQKRKKVEKTQRNVG